MKKEVIITVIILFIIVFLAGVVISYERLGVINPISALCGIAKIYWTDNKLTVVQNFPQKVVFFKREEGKDYFNEYMEELGGYIEIPYSADAGDTVYTNGEKNIYVKVAGNRFGRYTLTESNTSNADMLTYTKFENIMEYQDKCQYKKNINITANGEPIDFIVVPVKIDGKFYKTMSLQSLARNIENIEKESIKENTNIEINTSLQTVNVVNNINDDGTMRKIKDEYIEGIDKTVKSVGNGVYAVEIGDNNYETVLQILFK